MKNYAIKEHHLYNKAFQKGARFVTKTVAVYVLRDYAAKRLMLANPEKQYFNRVGLSVGKRLGGAVVRNRAKRLLREAYRQIKAEHGMKGGYLVILAARDEIRGKKTADVTRDMLRALRALAMLGDTEK